MYSCGPPLMDVQEWDDQHELTYSSYVRTRVVILKTCRRRWMIGRNGERRSGISAQAARHDDDVHSCIGKYSFSFNPFFSTLSISISSTRPKQNKCVMVWFKSPWSNVDDVLCLFRSLFFVLRFFFTSTNLINGCLTSWQNVLVFRIWEK